MAAIAVRIRWKRPRGKRPWAGLLLRLGLVLAATAALIVFCVFSYFDYKYQHIVDERLKQPIFANTAKIFAAPREVRPGQKLTVRLIANELHEAGYSADGASEVSLQCAPVRSPITHKTVQPSTSIQALSNPSPTITANRF